MTETKSEVWGSFPVSTVPRPIVLLDFLIRVEGGFVDSEAKSAWIAGAVESSVPLPAGVPDRVVAGRGDHGQAPIVLTVTGVEQGRAQFFCDRGPRLLPAYWLTITGMKQRCAVLDPACPLWWPSSVDQAVYHSHRTAFIDSDDTTLRLPTTGDILTEFVRAEFEEHQGYVVGRAVTRRHPPSSRKVTANLVRAEVSGKLSAPLGGRVLLDEKRRPLAVQVA